jgi:hypothetical protein
MRSATLALFASALISAQVHAAAPNMLEGMWEITTKMEMPGKSGTAMPQQTVKHCMTQKDIEDPRRTTPSAGERDSRCKMTDYKLQGNTASWKMTCDGMDGAGTVTYSGDSYSGNQTMAMKRGKEVMHMKMAYAGKRVGDCPKQK